MPTYETLVITPATLTDEEESSTVEALAQVITDGGGILSVNDRMGRRKLAFPIRKSDEGIYTRFLYDSDTAVPRELDRRIRINDKILRHMTVRMEPEWAEASKEQAKRDAEARAAAEAEAERQRIEAEQAAKEREAEEGAAATAAASAVGDTGKVAGDADDSDEGEEE